MIFDTKDYSPEFIREMADYTSLLNDMEHLEQFCREDMEKAYLSMALMSRIPPSRLPERLKEGIRIIRCQKGARAGAFVLGKAYTPIDLSRELFYGGVMHMMMILDYPDLLGLNEIHSGLDGMRR